MIRTLIFLAVSAALASCAMEPQPVNPPAEALSLSLTWRIEGLANPESLAMSEDGAALYVTNVNGEAAAKDGNGFIARISTDGRVLDREWVGGFNAPKGIARSGGLLYVADIDELVIVDIARRAIRARTPIAGARFLNDVAVLPHDTVLIADSGAGRIYSVQDGVVETWLADPLLAAVNGILVEPGRLVATTMQGRFLAIDMASRQITVLAEGLGDADGVAALGAGRYLVSEWPGLMHIVAADGTHETILDTRAERRFMNDFLLIDGALYQPHWEPGALSAYALTRRR